MKATRDAGSAGLSSFSMILDDGYVMVASHDYDPSSRSGTVYIRDKNGTTTCVFTNGEAKCERS
jgi:hypothetical protein